MSDNFRGGMVMTIQLDVPEELVQKYHLSEPSQVEHMLRIGLQQFRLEEALLLYQRGLVSLWKAATMAEISLREMILQASARGYEPAVDDEMLAEEMS
jgi:predicted HTH domain antitoxin